MGRRPAPVLSGPIAEPRTNDAEPPFHIPSPAGTALPKVAHRSDPAFSGVKMTSDAMKSPGGSSPSAPIVVPYLPHLASLNGLNAEPLFGYRMTFSQPPCDSHSLRTALVPELNV